MSSACVRCWWSADLSKEVLFFDAVKIRIILRYLNHDRVFVFFNHLVGGEK